MQCPRCHAENLPDAAFCEDCATVLEPRCPHCQADDPGTGRYCRKCGLPLARPPVASTAPASEPSRGATALYPRCGSVNVRKRMVVACLRLHDATGRVHKEVKTFGAKTPDLFKLSDWLSAQGVTHVVVAGSRGDWPRVCRVLEHAFTVSRTAEVNDAEALAERLALGLIQDVSPSPARAAQRGRHRTGHMALALLCASVSIGVGVWRYRDLPLPTILPPVAQWLSQTPMAAEEPVEVTLEGKGDRPSWLWFDGSHVRISGVAPLTVGDQPYHLLLRSRAGNDREGQLHVYVTRTEMVAPNIPPAAPEPGPTPSCP
jgi:Double zinc ribbon